MRQGCAGPALSGMQSPAVPEQDRGRDLRVSKNKRGKCLCFVVETVSCGGWRQHRRRELHNQRSNTETTGCTVDVNAPLLSYLKCALSSATFKKLLLNDPLFSAFVRKITLPSGSRAEICLMEGDLPPAQITSLSDVGGGVPEEPLTLKTVDRLLRWRAATVFTDI